MTDTCDVIVAISSQSILEQIGRTVWGVGGVERAAQGDQHAIVHVQHGVAAGQVRLARRRLVDNQSDAPVLPPPLQLVPGSVVHALADDDGTRP